jgi:hypothetical protein
MQEITKTIAYVARNNLFGTMNTVLCKCERRMANSETWDGVKEYYPITYAFWSWRSKGKPTTPNGTEWNRIYKHSRNETGRKVIHGFVHLSVDPSLFDNKFDIV